MSDKTFRQEIATIITDGNIEGECTPDNPCPYCKEVIDRICEAVLKMAEEMYKFKTPNPNPFRDSPIKRARNNAVSNCQTYLKKQVE